MTITTRGMSAPKSTKIVKETAASKAETTVKSLKSTKRKRKSEGSIPSSQRLKTAEAVCKCSLSGEPVLDEEARRRWPERYAIKKEKHRKDDKDRDLYARCHYQQALVNGDVYNLFDYAFIIGEDEKTNYIGRIVEIFESIGKKPYFTAQWFLKAENTVIKGRAELIDDRRVFSSDLRDENPLYCIISKIKVVQVPLNVDLLNVPPCDFYYNMKYSIDYSTFSKLDTENGENGFEVSSTVSREGSCGEVLGKVNIGKEESDITSMPQKLEMTLLDLFSGCGGMSTGLCLGGAISGINLVTRWAVDKNESACQSLQFNHPETKVMNESADDFLELLKKWYQLCEEFCSKSDNLIQAIEEDVDEVDESSEDQSTSKNQPTFEVEKLIDIRFGDLNESKKSDLYFKVRWKEYDETYDTWEPIDGLVNCKERIKAFVIDGCKSKILPLPGDVDVICGGPPCQGMSGYNRHRNVEDPLADPLNHQLEVYMDIVKHLKPRFVLMENVVDLVKFSGGFLGRHALGRLVSMDYQARLGLMVAGCYGLPQFRMRVFLWGACSTEKLPQYPLPTHEVVVCGFFPKEFKMNVVAYNEDQDIKLKKPLLLKDAIYDLPPVTNYETRDTMEYGKDAKTQFQNYIRLCESGMSSINSIVVKGTQNALLHDHLPLKMNDDDYQRACQIPKQKGANFRDLTGVVVRDNTVEWDTSIERVYLPSGKPLVPDYAMTFVRGKSAKPFARLWWNETVSTVVTRAEPHNQAILHPQQDRVLTIRENARLQGFPDRYRLFGTVRDRYIQVGNAVAVPVAGALGYALGMASQGKCDDQPVLTLPPKFPNCSPSSRS